MDLINRRWLLAERPIGLIEEKHFRWVEESIPEVSAGEFLVRVLYLSCDPTQRAWMSRDMYLPAVQIGEVVRSGGVGEVVSSRSEDFVVGDIVSGLVGWQDYAVLSAGGTFPASRVPKNVPIPVAMSFGLAGLTAYFGLLEVGRPNAGETVVVSGAAGATGSIAGQIARIKGCRVVGIESGKEKCNWLLQEGGFDGAIDCDGADGVADRLRELCPGGVDLFFDNVGGQQLDIVLEQIAMHGRVVLCGASSHDEDPTYRPLPHGYLNLLLKRGRIEGFVVSDYLPRAKEAVAHLATWLGEGKIKDRVDIIEGLENAPHALRRVFIGENQGKQLVKVV